MAEAGKTFFLRLIGANFCMIRPELATAIWLIRQPLEGLAPSSEHQIKEIARAISSMADRSRWSHSIGEEEQFEVRIIQANHTSTRLRLTVLQAKVGVSGKAKDTSSYNLIWRTREAELRGKQGE